MAAVSGTDGPMDGDQRASMFPGAVHIAARRLRPHCGDRLPVAPWGHVAVR